MLDRVSAFLCELVADEIDLDAPASQPLRGWAEQALRFVAERCGERTTPTLLARYVGARLERPARVAEIVALAGADLALACGCARGDPVALAAFERDVWPVVPQALRRLRVGSPLREDIEQRLRARLLAGPPDAGPGIASYGGRGRLEAWLRVVTAREAGRALDRERRYVPADDEAIGRLAATQHPDHALQLAKRESREALAAAFKAALRELEPRKQNLLRQRYIDGLSLAQLGSIHRVHLSTVHRWIEAAQQQLLDATLATLERQLDLDAGEARSLVRFARSRLSFTLGSAWDVACER